MGIGRDSSCVSQVQCSNAETALSFSMVVLEQAGWEMELKLANGRGLISGPHSTLKMTADLKRFWAQELGALDAMTTLKRKASVSQADGTYACDSRAPEHCKFDVRWAVSKKTSHSK